MAAKDLTHGMAGSRPYVIWMNMRSRCDNPSSTYYNVYGGRGISYEPAWKSFIEFWKDVGNDYQDGLSLERKNNNLGYSKENCEWIPLSDQALNRRKQNNNSSGKTGVSFFTNWFGTDYVRARWVSESGKDTVRYFSIKKYGEQRAFEMAYEYRQNAIDGLRDSGVKYSLNHGT